MKSKIQLKLISLYFLLVLIIIPFVKANPVITYNLDFFVYSLIFLPLVLFLTVFTEYIVIIIFIRKKLMNYIQLFKMVFVVNFISFPNTQIYTMLLIKFIQNIYFFYFLAELIPISLEIFLFLSIYHKFFKKGYLNAPLSFNTRIFSILSANLVSFLMGLLLNSTDILNVFKLN